MKDLEGPAPQPLHMPTRCPTQNLIRPMSLFHSPPSFSFASSKLAESDISLVFIAAVLPMSEYKRMQVQFESGIRGVFRARLQRAHDTGNTLTFLGVEDRRSRCFVRGPVDTAVVAEWRWQAEEVR